MQRHSTYTRHPQPPFSQLISILLPQGDRVLPKGIVLCGHKNFRGGPRSEKLGIHPSHNIRPFTAGGPPPIRPEAGADIVRHKTQDVPWRDTELAQDGKSHALPTPLCHR